MHPYNDPRVISGQATCSHELLNQVSNLDAVVAPIGAVINGAHPRRSSEDELTIFDGTGVGLQDLEAAETVVDLAVASGVAVEVNFLARCSGPFVSHLAASMRDNIPASAIPDIRCQIPQKAATTAIPPSPLKNPNIRINPRPEF